MRWLNYLLCIALGAALATAFWCRINDRDWQWWQGRYNRCVNNFVNEKR